MMRILHVLSQRPLLTGSGVTLDAIVRHAEQAGYQQCAVVGVPASAPRPSIGGLPSSAIRPLLFGSSQLPFPVPGMSDVMPYESTRFSSMSASDLARYRQAWREHVRAAIDAFRPDVIHSHHIWLLSSLLGDLTDIPVVTHCHATGLRQMTLCPHLADEVRVGCRRNRRFLVLHEQHRTQLAEALAIGAERIDVVGAGFRADVFHARGRTDDRAGQGSALAYAGKFSRAKGLPWLLDAVAASAEVSLHVAGAGAGQEADAIIQRLESMRPQVVLHGRLDQPALAQVLRGTDVFVLPSFYEGLPLVLVEALACGNRLVATTLPGIAGEIAPRVGDFLTLVEPPRLSGVDEPVADDLPAFVDRLCTAIAHARRAPPVTADDVRWQAALAPFTWDAVFGRIERVWRDLAA